MVEMKTRAETLNSILESRQAEFRIICRDLWKDNRIQTVYVLAGGSNNCCPTIYYDVGWYNHSDEVVADFLIKKAECSCNINAKEILQPDYIRTHILPRVVNGSNLEDLKKSGIVCRPYLDLAVLYYLPVEGIEDFEKGKATMQVSGHILSAAGIGDEEAHECAMRNLAETIDAMPMEQVLSVFFGDDKKAQGENICPYGMWVVSNKELCYGAAVLLFGETLFRTFEEKFHRKLGEEQKAVALPSSQQEIIIVPYQTEDQLWSYLEMVKGVNGSCVSDSDYLSDNVYFYDHKQKMVRPLV